jgi:hypothetical protein
VGERAGRKAFSLKQAGNTALIMLTMDMIIECEFDVDRGRQFFRLT